MTMFTDASDIAVGCYFRGQWFVVEFVGKLQYLSCTDINFRELLAITIALSTWAQHLPRCKILFRCDNEAVVQILNTGVSRNPQMMHLIRTIFYIGACHDFECKAVHIPSEHNSIHVADSLSRLQWQRFRLLAPHADVHPVLPILMDWRLY